jgi:hypothetical protein
MDEISDYVTLTPREVLIADELRRARACLAVRMTPLRRPLSASEEKVSEALPVRICEPENFPLGRNRTRIHDVFADID